MAENEEKKNLQENDRILTEREYCEKYNLSRNYIKITAGA